MRGISRALWREFREEHPIDQHPRLSDYSIKPDKKAAKLIRKIQFAIDFLSQSNPSKGDNYTSQLASILTPSPPLQFPHFDPIFLKDYYRLKTDEEHREKRKAAWAHYLPATEDY